MLVARVQTDHLALLMLIVLKCVILQRTIHNEDFFLLFSFFTPQFSLVGLISFSYHLLLLFPVSGLSDAKRLKIGTDGLICRTSSEEGTRREIPWFFLCTTHTVRWRCSLTDFSGLVKKISLTTGLIPA